MRGTRLALTVLAVVIGVASAVLGNWWTVTAMVLVLVSQVLAARRAAVATGSGEPPRR